MKKLSEQNRRFFERQSRKGHARSKRVHTRALAILQAKRDFLAIRSKLPSPWLSFDDVPGYLSFRPPSKFSIYDNYEETLAFLLDFGTLLDQIPSRDRAGLHTYAYLSAIEELDAASGLLLAAQIDRWRRSTHTRPRPHDHLWHESVKDYFHDAGLFELLGVDPNSARSQVAVSPKRKTMPFQTGTFHEGATADRFRRELEALVGRSLGPRSQVYDALSEAMTNVANHAYPREIQLWPTPLRSRWWLGGSWLQKERIATVQMYDQGVGIPRTLPRAEHWSEVLPVFGRIDRERTDAGMIEAAMDYGRTSTGQVGRGKGLAQMAEWIASTGNGSLRIVSGRGALTYLPGQRPMRRNLPAEFRGTLVEWTVHL